MGRFALTRVAALRLLGATLGVQASLFVGCGGMVVGKGQSDGAVRDSGAPKDSTVSHTDADESGEAPDGSTDSTVDVSPSDASQDQISDCSREAGAPFEDACTPSTCAAGEYCGYSESTTGGKSLGRCITIPSCCEMTPTCGCVLASIEACVDAGCTDTSGHIVVTCVEPPPP
jgi:hypothetical protein